MFTQVAKNTTDITYEITDRIDDRNNRRAMIV